MHPRSRMQAIVGSQSLHVRVRSRRLPPPALARLTHGLPERARHVTRRPLSRPAHRHVCARCPAGSLIKGPGDGPKRLCRFCRPRQGCASVSRRFSQPKRPGMPDIGAHPRDTPSPVCPLLHCVGGTKQGPVPKKANHPKGWDAKPLAYVRTSLDMAAGLPGEDSTSPGLCLSHGRTEVC
jgi:hypothetical protein